MDRIFLNRGTMVGWSAISHLAASACQEQTQKQAALTYLILHVQAKTVSEMF
ncbi:hypothetical protein PNH38_06230 [Anoxybacillus rupiensis]|uniref:Uncharacterized protein n=1 Tax=Anoxybacteroides rupiense TaxID=311460 RepID=A0ABT5W4K3_9BACL|nr:hypothetical protein [Anoxybacillus rupiensis]